MKNTFLLITIILLTGCATPADRRSSPPDIVTSSKISAKEVAICIADKWEDTKPFGMFTSPQVNTSLKSNGYSITAINIGGFGNTMTIALADVTENQLESITKYFKMWGGGLGDYDKAVQDCQLAIVPEAIKPVIKYKSNPHNNF